jgi:hypothetical protein
MRFAIDRLDRHGEKVPLTAIGSEARGVAFARVAA